MRSKRADVLKSSFRRFLSCCTQWAVTIRRGKSSTSALGLIPLLSFVSICLYLTCYLVPALVNLYCCSFYRCSLTYIDFEGRSDGESIKRILTLVNPRKLVGSYSLCTLAQARKKWINERKNESEWMNEWWNEKGRQKEKTCLGNYLWPRDLLYTMAVKGYSFRLVAGLSGNRPFPIQQTPLKCITADAFAQG